MTTRKTVGKAVSKAAWTRLRATIKRLRAEGAPLAAQCKAVTTWEGVNAPLKWGTCPKCHRLTPTVPVRVTKCLLCGSKVTLMLGMEPADPKPAEPALRLVEGSREYEQSERSERTGR